MLGSLLKFVIKFIIFAVLISALYLVAYNYMWIPKQYIPAKLFATQYKEMQLKLYKDAVSNSPTSKVSQKLYVYFRETDAKYSKPAAPVASQSTSNSATQNTDENGETKPATPIDSAKQKIENYNEAIQERDKILDQL